MDLSARSDEDLLSEVAKLMGSHRELTARLVAHLAEIEERRLHLLRGFSSMFDFCTNELRFSAGEAFRRILAARLSRRFPVVIPLLAVGSVNLSTLELLRELLTDENHEELFAVLAGKSKRDIQAFLAARFPRPDRPSRIRRATIEPLSEARFAIEFTASEALRQKLELCRDLMSHANPRRDLAVVIERAVDLLLDDLEKTRLGRSKRSRLGTGAREAARTDDTNAAKESQPIVSNAPERGTHAVPAACRRKSSRIAVATRREVFERDGLRCTYMAETGRRCEARAFLELDHVDAKALGGSNGSRNLRVRCRAHNQLAAEQVFGREHVEWSRHFRQQKSSGAASESTTAIRREHAANTATPTTTSVKESENQAKSTFEKVRLALRGLGFHADEARRAVAAVVSVRDSNEPVALEQALREALLAATAA